ncbi:MAG: Anti-sigma F factor antagonist [Pelotomaculum sp. PtaB.Bin104]|nr:MAG: Anti-sigma F factor antagonist [Pelotomaculum sp. PtaB.Bin104]
MRLDLEYKENTLIVRLSGDLDMGIADSLRNSLEEALDRQPVLNLVFNLAGVSFLDSSILGVLLGRYKRISKIGGSVCIVEPQPQVRRILELSGLFLIMNEFPGEDVALENIS